MSSRMSSISASRGESGIGIGSPLGEYAPRSTAWTDYNALAGELFDAGVIPAGPDGAGTEGAASIDEGATT